MALLPSPPSSCTPPFGVVVRGPHDPGRDVLEAVVSEVYSHLHGARITHFLPLLVGLVDGDGVTTGVIGARLLDTRQPAFLEAYLDAPIEAVLGRALGAPVAREGLVEVGNLAARTAGGGRALVGVLGERLHALGREWAVFTSTDVLRRLFARLGVALVDLGPADGTRLGPALADWGRYYERAPRVSAARIGEVAHAARAARAAARRAAPRRVG